MKEITLKKLESGERIAHLMEDREHWAIQAALAADRPLLVRGEPGTGKTQLAWAAATLLGRPLISLTVDSNTQSRDLMWTFDAVQRLAEAQVASMCTTDKEELRKEIAVKRFVRPGPLWWAFHWDSANRQLPKGESPPALMPAANANWSHEQGVVILIDEIDKAESDVPNGLLEALGSRQFIPQGWDRPIERPKDVKPPLIVITTNEERVLPAAFVRRCFVVVLRLPDVDDREGFVDYLVKRGTLHFPGSDRIMIQPPADTQPDGKPESLPAAAASVVLSDRRRAIANHQIPRPGQAEYLDFLRAIVNLAAEGKDPNQVFLHVQSFVFNKASGLDG